MDGVLLCSWMLRRMRILLNMQSCFMTLRVAEAQIAEGKFIEHDDFKNICLSGLAYRGWLVICCARNLIETNKYIASENPEAARKVIIDIFEAGNKIKAFPEKGRIVPELRRKI